MRPTIGPRLDLRQSQSLVMTPQLQQAIKLLQLSNLELVEYVEGELEQNPLLERDEAVLVDSAPAEEPAPLVDVAEPRDALEGVTTDRLATGDDAPLDLDPTGALDGGDDGTDWGGLDTGIRGGAGRRDDDLPGIEQTASNPVSLRDHLLAQAVDLTDPGDRLIAAAIIDLVDESGYLSGDLGQVVEAVGASLERVEAVLARVQRFDPSGVAARSLKECLALQLAERDRLDPTMQRLLDHLPLLAARDVAQLQRLVGVDGEELALMVAELRALDPKPGLRFDGAPIQAVVPDILMRAVNGDWQIELNPDSLPRVLVNQRYLARVDRGRLGKADRDYLSERLQSANWLVKSLHQRATTILKVATEIVRQQGEFFVRGVEGLKPLILRDIAQAIGMHESTVSRVTTNKYIQTPRGIFELKYFFTTAIASAGGGEAHSAETVRHRIRTLIDQESADAILSDDRLVEILRGDGVDIARRTIAKYREAMRIPSSVHRRRDKLLAGRG
jgi:RNA polymerase sigma-54 factor